MAIYEYYCEECKFGFEQITSSSDEDAGRCPKCNKKSTRKLFSKFAVTGRAESQGPCGGCDSGGGSGGCPFSSGGNGGGCCG